MLKNANNVLTNIILKYFPASEYFAPNKIEQIESAPIKIIVQPPLR